MPRRKRSAEEKMAIVVKGMTPDANISEICRGHGITQTLCYR
ncbi:hypothetical protein [Effusibacillus dendaii]|uniref:Transposase n=1 Tax=Effusibacillus dendaii TaxID=2743772 RepID=A0A7I8D6C6_9BACL|nr:hypothetical protein [Effusibacillus dendaii]BCJ85703.1 hypothetical protein skT53_06880 [Effusibacillus dendaii]